MQICFSAWWLLAFLHSVHVCRREYNKIAEHMQ